MLLLEAKEHKRAITCFALSESGDSILSGSSDKTVRVCDQALLSFKESNLINKTSITYHLFFTDMENGTKEIGVC